MMKAKYALVVTALFIATAARADEGRAGGDEASVDPASLRHVQDTSSLSLFPPLRTFAADVRPADDDRIHLACGPFCDTEVGRGCATGGLIGVVVLGAVIVLLVVKPIHFGSG